MNKTDSIFTEGATFIEDSCTIEFIKRAVEISTTLLSKLNKT